MIEAKPLQTIEQFSEAVRLQQEIWGFADRDLIPLRVFAVATKIGGQAFGGFDGDRMAGFCLAFPAMKPAGNMPYLHS
ncbi:MAG: acetyltransferase, partial [Bryobacteraceae bacterium]|nr:acetyltransferase [Bryobacteraceae bacterium]